MRAKFTSGIPFGVRNSAALAAIFMGLWSSTALAQTAVIDNGTIQLGINDFGTLITPGQIGLTYLPTSTEALAPGCDCEGWGIADLGVIGHDFGRSQDNGDSGTGTSILTFGGAGTVASSNGSTATATTDITQGGNPFARVVHDFAPSASSNLYQVDVTMTNLGGLPITNLVYRRVMDWDVAPTTFSEFVTLQGWPATALIASSDDGFENPNPNVATLGSITAPVNSNFSDSGPADHGAGFDFSFGTLAADGTQTFTIFYGAAGTVDEALAALGTVGAEVYSLGYPNDGSGGPNPTGTPNVFIFAFAGVGGTPVGPGVGPRTDLEMLRAMGVFVAQKVIDDPLLRMDGSVNGGEDPSGGGTVMSGLRYIATGGIAQADFTTSTNVDATTSLAHGGLAVEHAFGASNGVRGARLGVGLDLGRATGDHDNDSSGSAGAVTLYTYGGASFDNGAYVDAVLGYTWLNYDWNRLQALGGYNGNTNGGQFSGLVRAGVDRPITWGGLTGSLSGGVFGSLQFVSNSINGYTETSAVLPGGAVYGDHGANSTITKLGGRMTYQTKTQSGTNITGQAWLAWEHQQFGADTVSVNGANVVLDSVKRDLARVGMRLSAQVSPNGTFSAEYEGGFGKSFTENSLTARFKFQF